MKYLVKDEYYDLKDEDKVLHSAYRLVDNETPSGAILGDLAEMMFPEYQHDKWEELFQENKLVINLKPLLDGNKLHSVEIKKGCIELTSTLQFWGGEK